MKNKDFFDCHWRCLVGIHLADCYLWGSSMMPHPPCNLKGVIKQKHPPPAKYLDDIKLRTKTEKYI